jgi:hypothetical protein
MMGLNGLAGEFWAWRAATQPDSYDDITRIERPAGWVADWSPGAVQGRRRALESFVERYRELDLTSEPVAVQVDGRLLGCALARTHWELELLRGWERNPRFHLDQALVPIYNRLLEPPPIDAARADALLRHLRRVPVVLVQARENLAGRAAPSFAEHAVRALDAADARLRTAMHALTAHLPRLQAAGLPAATDLAAAALGEYREWLEAHLPSFTGPTAPGPAAFAFFLHRVALLPHPVERLRAQGRQELARAVATEAVIHNRYRGAPEPPLAADLETHLARQRSDELAVRRFYVERGLLNQPAHLRHYRFAEVPAYLEPLTWLGVPHYCGAPTRQHEDAVRYVPAPRPDLPYFALAAARDPRTALAHEGVHAQQLALSWAHPDPARRHHYDSAVNEGIAFYHEELMLLSGLFDDAPASAEFIGNAMRLRALRVEVDVALALGEISVDDAAAQLAETVPMDRRTAWEEAVFFAGNPGQGLSYQVGKLQVLDLLAACQQHAGPAFDLRGFHDRLWREGNVPLALQRWEVLGRRDHRDEADRLAFDRARGPGWGGTPGR